VAKAYDFERVNSLLTAKADSLEQVERQLCYFVSLWNGKQDADFAPDATATDKVGQMVEYPKDFDVRGLYDEFDIAARLTLIDAPDAMRRQQMDAVIDKLFPMLEQDLVDKMKSELKQWPPKDVLAAPGAGGSPVSGAEIQKTGGKQVAGQMLNPGKKAA
jgi:hypothetical protein